MSPNQIGPQDLRFWSHIGLFSLRCSAALEYVVFSQRIVTNLVPFCRSQWDLSNGTKFVTIAKILIFVMHQKNLWNGVDIVRPQHCNDPTQQSFNPPHKRFWCHIMTLMHSKICKILNGMLLFSICRSNYQLLSLFFFPERWFIDFKFLRA